MRYKGLKVMVLIDSWRLNSENRLVKILGFSGFGHRFSQNRRPRGVLRLFRSAAAEAEFPAEKSGFQPVLQLAE
jgi:hypothetical protein